MKKRLFLYLFLLVISCIVTGCHDLNSAASKMQKTLNEQESKAIELTSRLEKALATNSIDSIWAIARSDENILMYVFDNQGAKFWSTNWLSTSHVYLNRYGVWEYRLFDNAHVVCRWTSCGEFNILTVIPVKYCYSVKNEILPDGFLPAFKFADRWDVTRSQKQGGVRILSPSGDYLFSLVDPVEDDGKEKVEATRLAESFSYQGVLTTGDSSFNKKKIHVYSILCVLLFLGFIGWCIADVLHSHGWSNMLLTKKFGYSMMLLLLFSFGYVFLISGRFTRSLYGKRQKEEMLEKTHFIQRSLQQTFFWQMALDESNTRGLNVELRDLCFTYETDINVYDLNGMLIGSSSPALFDLGLMSRRMQPEAFFFNGMDSTYQEHIGEVEYLSTYTELVNGSYVPIGYISVPSYVSTEKVQAELDDFLARMFPYYLFAIVFSLLLASLLSRGISRPLMALADSLTALKIGGQNTRLEYHKKDEIGTLVERYNEMVDQLDDSAAKLAKSEREGAWRTMARQIAHEINNPLTPMKLSIQQMQRLKDNDDERFDAFFRRSTNMLVEQIDDLSHIASSFSTFAKMPEVAPDRVDVSEKLYSVIQLFRNNQEHVPVRYVGAEHGVHAMADDKQIGQVFNNLIKNALQAIENRPNGDIIVILKDMDKEVEVSVLDNGCGIPEEIRDKVFVPNFTTKSTGTGLGLAISKNIVEGCGGSLRFETGAKGTVFYVTLPK